jgi:uncharacterized protein YrrD
MKFSQLRGLAVVDLQDAKKLGDLEDLLLEPTSRQVLGLKVKTKLFSSTILIPISSMKTAGSDAITVVVPALTDAEPSQSSQSSQSEPDLRNMVGLSQLLDNQVVTDSGSLVGNIKDVLLNPDNLEVTGYLVSTGGLFARTQEFPATPDVRYGVKLVTVPAMLFDKSEQAK